MFIMRPLMAVLAPTPRDMDRTFTPEVRAAVEAAPDRILTDDELSAAAGFPIRTKFYFAYGSNLLSDVFTKRRGIDPLQTLPCTMRGYTLTFDLPAMPMLEPAMANVRRCSHVDAPSSDAASAAAEAADNHTLSCDECAVHGVAYRITAEQMRHLHSTELSYDLITCRAVTYGPNHHKIHVEVLVAKPRVRRLLPHEQEHARPSLRYLTILRNGAREKRLADHWIERLDGEPAAPVPPVLAKIAVALLLAGPALLFVLYDRVSLLWTSPAQREETRHRLIANVSGVLWSAFRAQHAVRARVLGAPAPVAASKRTDGGLVAASPPS